MFDDFLDQVCALRRSETPFAVAIVVRFEPPVSGKPGDKAIIGADGSMSGWIGGGCVQPLVIREALKAIANGKPRLVRVAPSCTSESDEGTVNYTMTCHGGGALDIYIEPVLAKPQILIMGRSAVAKAICILGKAIGYRITVVAAGAGPRTFPQADATAEELQVPPEEIGPGTFIVVSTQGEQDEEALDQACRTNASYISFVSSDVKTRKVFDFLAAKGVPQARLARIKAPAGLRLGGVSPEEIALSILAEIVLVRKTEATGIGQNEIPGGELSKAGAKDPVCGMAVEAIEAKYISEYRGETFYFCCAGCKQAFDLHPENYLVTSNL